MSSLRDLKRNAQEAFLETAMFIVKTDGIVSVEEAQRMKMYRTEFNISEAEYPADGKDNKLEMAIEVLRLLPKYEREMVFEEFERLAQCDMDYCSGERIVINALKEMLEL